LYFNRRQAVQTDLSKLLLASKIKRIFCRLFPDLKSPFLLVLKACFKLSYNV